MDTLFTMSKHTHMLGVILLIISQGVYFWIEKEHNFILFSRKLGTLLLVQNIFIGIVAFTGLLMLAVLKFKVWNLEIVMMVLVIVGVALHQLLIHRKRKPIKSDEKELQQRYKKWVGRVYLAEIGAEVAVFIIAIVLNGDM